MGIKPFDIRNIGRTGIINPKQIGYQDSLDIISEELHRTRRSFVKIGWYLKHIREKEMYKEEDYANIYELALDKFNLSQPTATRFMNICEQFSVGHDSPELDEQYIDFSMSQLFEMLPMKQEEMSRITPDMTVAQIRDFKKKGRDGTENEGIPGQTSIQKDFREFMPDGCSAEEAVDAEYCEKLQEAIETPEAEEKIQEHDEGWLVREFERWNPETAKEIREAYYGEADPAKRAKAVQECLAPYGVFCGGSEERSFDFHGFKEGLDLREGTEEKHFTYAEFARLFIGNEDGPKEPKHGEENCPEEELSAYGLPKTVYPEGSLLTEEGCGNKYDCFSCTMGDCGIRQKDRYCREAPLGSPFACKTMEVLDDIRWDPDMKERCQFLDDSLAYHTPGSGEPSPCCKECKETCDYRCWRSLKSIAAEQEEGAARPDIPRFKNNDQRKEWLQNYKKWGLWYRDGNIDVNYYKFDFEDGSRLIVAEYPLRRNVWSADAKDEYFFHLLEKDKEGYGGKKYDEKYQHMTECETYLVEFLKKIQLKG